MAVRTGPVAIAAVVVVTAGTALTAGLSGVPDVSADQYLEAWPSYVLTSGPSYPDGSTVTFTISPAAGQARARVDDGSAPGWSDCTGDGTTWSCPVHSISGTFEWLAVP
jgi:hypothetical protein